MKTLKNCNILAHISLIFSFLISYCAIPLQGQSELAETSKIENELEDSLQTSRKITPLENKNMTNETMYQLNHFFEEDTLLDQKVEKVFQSLTDRQRVGQMLVNAAGEYGWPRETILEMVRKQELGGVLLLNGEFEGFKQLVAECDEVVRSVGGLPLIYSADAEPSLVNRKIKGTQSVPPTSELDSLNQVQEVAKTIAHDLKEIGIRHNFAPVLDMSTKNPAIKNRSFGNSLDEIVKLAGAFMLATQEEEVLATIKHFPGHGLVEGDTHSKLVYIDGEKGDFPELPAYPPLIDSGVISVMVGHIAVRNIDTYDTGGLPASCSRLIVTDLLKDSLGFEGIVITDAMNMGALKEIPKSTLKAMQAGCDMILMPGDSKSQTLLIEDALALLASDETFKAEVYESVKKILRLKYCLNLL